MSNKMISLKEGIELTIEYLRSEDSKYNWYDQEFCVCGLVVKNMLTEEEFKRLLDYELGVWTHTFEELERSKTLNPVWESLKERGLTVDSVNELEHLEDKSILEEIGIDKKIDPSPYRNKEAVLSYLKVLYKRMQEQEN